MPLRMLRCFALLRKFTNFQMKASIQQRTKLVVPSCIGGYWHE